MLGGRPLLSLLLLGLVGLLYGGQLGLVHLLQGVPLLPVVQQALQHGGDFNVEAAELLEDKDRMLFVLSSGEIL